jgi:hypothetical protein
VLPFEKSGAAPTKPAVYPRMPLQGYASFCAELAVFPDQTPAVLSKYRVESDAARAALDQEWQARFAANPDTAAEHQALVVEYQEWLRRQPRA